MNSEPSHTTNDQKFFKESQLREMARYAPARMEFIKDFQAETTERVTDKLSKLHEKWELADMGRVITGGTRHPFEEWAYGQKFLKVHPEGADTRVHHRVLVFGLVAESLSFQVEGFEIKVLSKAGQLVISSLTKK